MGRDAAVAERAAGPKRSFVVLEVEDGDADVVGYESMMHEGRAVGYVTSGAYGHCVGASLAAGYVPTPLARDGATFEIDILGTVRRATVRRVPLVDPTGTRLRRSDAAQTSGTGRVAAGLRRAFCVRVNVAEATIQQSPRYR